MPRHVDGWAGDVAMTYTPPRDLLHGLSLERAELYGKPHLGARYTGRGARRYERTSPGCRLCGRPSASCHHLAPLGMGESFTLSAPAGEWALRSPLAALCGSGTCGCHGAFHSGLLKVRWAWDADEAAEAWWRGWLLATYRPHAPELYGHGRWEVEDTRTGKTTTIREGF